MLPWAAEAPQWRTVAHAHCGKMFLMTLSVIVAVWAALMALVEGVGLAAGNLLHDGKCASGLVGGDETERARKEAAIVLGLCVLVAVLLTTLAVLLMGLAKWKELPRLLTNRRPKPAPKSFMQVSVLTTLAGCVTSIVSMSICGASLGALGAFTFLVSFASFFLLVISWLIDLELYKPPDANTSYDSIILHYVRCLCWSRRKRHLVLVAVPFYVFTLVGVIDCLYYWNRQQEELGDCEKDNRIYLLVATLLLASYSAIVTCAAFARTSLVATEYHPSKRMAQTLLGYMLISSFGWGTVGGSLLLISATTQCKYLVEWHIAAGMHALLVVFGSVLAFFSLCCRTEAIIIDYYTYFDLADSSSETG